MKLIESKAEILKQEDGLQGIYKMIELAGRTCYKSEDKITPDSAKEFVERMIKSGHTAMLEHGTVYINLENKSFNFDKGWIISKLMQSPYTKFDAHYQPSATPFFYEGYITTSMRVIIENNAEFLLEYICEPTEHHERRITLKFTTDRGVSHELVRHRAFSFAQESTRYCNYSKDKFGKEVTFIKPSWYTNDDHEQVYTPMITEFEYSCISAEHLYFNMLAHGAIPQQARQVLPNALKTEIVMTGFASDWKHFFDLRLLGITGKPHPDMLLLAEKAKKVLEENNLWNLIYKED